MSVDEEAVRIALRNEVRRKVRNRVRAKIAFVWHLVVFAMVNAALYAINQVYSPETTWFVWPLAGWGAALIMHGLVTFTGTGLTENMVETEVEREFARRGLDD